MTKEFSFVTNATDKDASRLYVFLPLVLKVFDQVISELLVVVDQTQESGRIRSLHKDEHSEVESLNKEFLSSIDPRIKFINLDYSHLDIISKRWFNVSGVNRCQVGTPIYAFLYAIERAESDYILKSDCDILFYDAGFIKKIDKQRDNYDLIQFPFLKDADREFSTRAYFINRNRVYSKLPIRLLKLDFLRGFHRRLHGRSRYMALEQTLDFNIIHHHLTSLALTQRYGSSMHIASREDFRIYNMMSIGERFIRGAIPVGQKQGPHDFIYEYWT